MRSVLVCDIRTYSSYQRTRTHARTYVRTHTYTHGPGTEPVSTIQSIQLYQQALRLQLDNNNNDDDNDKDKRPPSSKQR